MLTLENAQNFLWGPPLWLSLSEQGRAMGLSVQHQERCRKDAPLSGEDSSVWLARERDNSAGRPGGRGHGCMPGECPHLRVRSLPRPGNLDKVAARPAAAS